MLLADDTEVAPSYYFYEEGGVPQCLQLDCKDKDLEAMDCDADHETLCYYSKSNRY